MYLWYNHFVGFSVYLNLFHSLWFLQTHVTFASKVLVFEVTENGNTQVKVHQTCTWVNVQLSLITADWWVRFIRVKGQFLFFLTLSKQTVFTVNEGRKQFVPVWRRRPKLTMGRPGSHLVEHIRKQTSDRACLAKGANDNFTALHKKLLEVANED